MANEFLNASIEKISKTLPVLYEVEGKNTLYGLMQKTPAEKIVNTTNGADFRKPLKLSRAGVFGAANLDGGAILTGSKTNIKQMVQTFFPVQLSMALTMKDVYNTQKAELSIVNALNDAMKDAPRNLVYYADASLHALGSAQGLVALGTAVTSAGAGTETVTCDTAMAANLVTEGMRLEIYANNLGTHRTSAVPDNLPYVSGVDKTAGTFIITNLGAITPQATDYYAFPGAGTTPAWSNGLGYFHNIATSGNMLGLAKGTYPQLNINAINASSGLFVPDHVWQAKQRIRQRIGSVPKLTGLLHDAQAYQVAALNLSISNLMVTGGAKGVVDVAPTVDETVPLAGISFLLDIHQDKTRVELLNMKSWERVELIPKDFFKLPGQESYIRVKREATTAAATFAIEFTMLGSENYVCDNPAGEAVIYGLAIGAGH